MKLTLAAVVLAAGVLGCRGGVSDKPPVHLIQNMMIQERGRPYRADHSGLFADGQLMRSPVEGTVAIGQLNEDDTYFEGLSADGGTPTLAYPAALLTEDKISEATHARGKARYQIYCVPCHGEAGDGKGLVAARGMVVPPADFNSDRVKLLPVGKIYAAIRGGVNNGNMASYAAQIPVADRWAIVTYVRQLQMAKDPKVVEQGGEAVQQLAAATVATLERGAALYKTKTCNACHSLNGTRLVGPSWKGLYGKTEATSAGEVTVDDAYLKESILEPAAKVTTGFPPVMPKLPIDPVDVDSLILFIKSQQ